MVDVRDPSKPMLRDVIEVVCREYGGSPAELTGAHRYWFLHEPRGVAYILSRDVCGRGSVAIAYYHNRDHSSVLNLERKVRARMATDDVFRHRVERMADAVRALHAQRLTRYAGFVSEVRA